MNEFASSLGLPGAPKIKFVQEARAKAAAQAAKEAKEAQEAHTASSDEHDAVDDEDVHDGKGHSRTASEPARVRTKHDRLFGRTNQTVLSKHYASMLASDSEDDSDAHRDHELGDTPDENDDFLTLARADHELDEPPTDLSLIHI